MWVLATHRFQINRTLLHFWAELFYYSSYAIAYDELISYASKFIFANTPMIPPFTITFLTHPIYMRHSQGKNLLKRLLVMNLELKTILFRICMTYYIALISCFIYNWKYFLFINKKELALVNVATKYLKLNAKCRLTHSLTFFNFFEVFSG